MKKTLISLFGCTLIFTLTACSDDPTMDNNPKEQVVPGDNENNPNTPDDPKKDTSGNKANDGKVADDQDAAVKMENLQFTTFDLDVEYGPDAEYDFEYKQISENGDYEAELDDSVNNKRLNGMEAFNFLYTQFQDVKIDVNTPKEEIILSILDRFQLNDDYNSFDLDINFKDGTKIDIEDKK